jgi:uracil-DNA glycosylase family 4
MPAQNCVECPLNEYKGAKVPAWSGSRCIGEAEYREVGYRGPRDGADIVVVGDNPTGFDMYANRAFTGDVGEMVDAELKSSGLNPGHVFFANACRCLLHKTDKTHKKTLKKALACCRPALERVMTHLKPKLVVCFGEVATLQVLGQGGVTRLRGKLQRSEEFGCWVFPTFHPGVCYRDQSKLAFWRPDMAFIGEFAKAGFDQRETDGEVVYKDVSSIDFILAQENITVALDTETQGKDWTDINSVVISYSITDKTGTGYNVWLCRECAEEAAEAMIQWPRKVDKAVTLKDVFIQYALDYNKKIFELQELCSRPDIKIVMQHGNYDLHRLRQLGIDRNEINSYVLDTQLVAHTLDSTNFIKASLSEIQSAYLNNRTDHKISFKQSADISDMLASSFEDPERHTQYSCADTDITYSCAKILRTNLLKDRKLANYYVHMAHPVQSIVLYEIEKNGIPFDVEKLPETKDRIAKILRDKERSFIDLVPPRIKRAHEEAGLKLSRPRFLRDVFFSEDGFGLPVGWLTGTGEASTNRTILRRLRDSLPDNAAKEALSILIEWGPYQKLYTTYLKGFEAAVKSDGRLHTQITKAGTETGRSSSSNPNLQNIPKRNKEIMRAIRSMLYAPEGKMLVAVDYSQSELRWIAHESMDASMVNIFKNGDDMHVITARDMAAKKKLKWDDMDDATRKNFRQQAKPVNFGFPYGQSAKGFQIYALDNYGAKFTLAEAELYRKTFLEESYPGLRSWHRRRISEARQFGFVRSEFGFIRHTPNISSTEQFLRGADERIAVNTGIQSASNDATLLGALEARRSGLVDDVRAQIVLFIHDELIYMVDEDYIDFFVPGIIENLENIPTERFGFKMRVPLVAEASIGKNLADMIVYKQDGK